MIDSAQRPLPPNTQQSQETDAYVLGGIRTLNPKNQADADPRFWHRNHWNRFYISLLRFFLHKNRKWENILKLMAASFPFLYSALNLINIEKIIFNACNIYIYILHNIHVYYVHAQWTSGRVKNQNSLENFIYISASITLVSGRQVWNPEY